METMVTLWHQMVDLHEVAPTEECYVMAVTSLAQVILSPQQQPPQEEDAQQRDRLRGALACLLRAAVTDIMEFSLESLTAIHGAFTTGATASPELPALPSNATLSVDSTSGVATATATATATAPVVEPVEASTAAPGSGQEGRREDMVGAGASSSQTPVGIPVSAQWTTIGADGKCSVTGQQLRLIGLTSEEKDRIRGTLQVKVCLTLGPSDPVFHSDPPRHHTHSPRATRCAACVL